MKRNKRLTLCDVEAGLRKLSDKVMGHEYGLTDDADDALDKLWGAIQEARNEEEAKRKETTEIDDWAEKHLIICGTD